MEKDKLTQLVQRILDVGLSTHSLYVSYIFMLIVSFNVVGLPIVAKVLIVPMIVEMLISAYIYEKRKDGE